MFSSRRSRNRHSANPNAKLHVDLQRRTSTAARTSTAGFHHQLGLTGPARLAHSSCTLSSISSTAANAIDESLRVKKARYSGSDVLSMNRYHQRGTLRAADILNRAETTGCWQQDHTEQSTAAVRPSTAMYTSWCHSDDPPAGDSFCHLTKLAEMTNIAAVTTSRQHATAATSHESTTLSAVPSMQTPAARKRKNILPTRCESHEEPDWSADSDNEFDSMDCDKEVHQSGQRLQQRCNVEDDWMSTCNSADVHCGVEEPPVDCVVPRDHQDTCQVTSAADMCVDHSSRQGQLTHTGKCKHSQSLSPCSSEITNNEELQQHISLADKGSSVQQWRADQLRHVRPDSGNSASTDDVINNSTSQLGRTSPDNDDDDDDCNGDEVHLCTVHGCTATFVSMRSRDRHSANVQLHQKLLSTKVASSTCLSLDDDDNRSADANDARSLQRDASEDRSPRSSAWLLGMNTATAAACIYYMQTLRRGLSSCSPLQSAVKPLSTVNSTVKDKRFLSDTAALQCLDCHVDRALVNTATISRASSPDVSDSTTLTNCRRDDSCAPRPAAGGTAECHVCRQTFQDNLVLKEHIEKLHPREMYRCTVPGCDKIFSTRKSRNRHSQNDNLHYVVFP